MSTAGSRIFQNFSNFPPTEIWILTVNTGNYFLIKLKDSGVALFNYSIRRDVVPPPNGNVSRETNKIFWITNYFIDFLKMLIEFSF